MNKKKGTINVKNKDDKCFQYEATVTLNYGEIKWNSESFSNVKPFISDYNWDKIKYTSKIGVWKTFKKEK